MKTLIRFIMLLGLTTSASSVLAGNLDNAGSPTAGSGMPTTNDIYNRLATGAVTNISATFKEPSAGPTGGTGRTLAEIGNLLPVPDGSNGAVAGEVLSGRMFWGLGTGDVWGPHTGTAAPGNDIFGVNGVRVISIPNGLYTGSKTVTAADTNLVSGNIKSGVTVFGVSGSPNVVDTTEAIDPTAATDISNGKKAYVNGALVTGTLYGGYTCSGTMNGTRWCDNGNGTVRDMTTGLIWLKDASWGGTAGWAATFDKVSIVQHGTPATLTDGSAVGDWRMPTITELVALTSGNEAVKLGSPWSFTGVQGYYWSSSSYLGTSAYIVTMVDGVVGTLGKLNISYYVWPVRGGEVRSASFIISATTISTSESGTSATFTVRLGSQPTATVTFPVSSSNLAEGTVDKASLTFTKADWNVNQTVTVTGVSDSLADGNAAYTIILGTTTSADALYNGLDPADVAVTNIDVAVQPSGDFAVNVGDNTLYKLKATDGTIIWGPVSRGNCGGLAVDQVDFGVYTSGSANCTGGGTGAVYKYDASGASAWSTSYADCGTSGNYYVGNGGIAVDTTSGTPGVVLTKSGYYGSLGKVSRTNGSTIFCDATNDLGRPTIDPANGQIYAITNAGSSLHYNTLYSVTASGSLSSASSCEGYMDLNPADGMLYRGGRDCNLMLYQMNKSSLGATIWSMSLSAYISSFDALALQPWSSGYIYVASVSSSKIVVIDPSTQSVVRTFNTAITPNNIAVNPSGGSLIISNNVSHFVYAYSPTGTLLWTSPDLGGPVKNTAAARGIVGGP